MFSERLDAMSGYLVHIWMQSVLLPSFANTIMLHYMFKLHNSYLWHGVPKCLGRLSSLFVQSLLLEKMQFC